MNLVPRRPRALALLLAITFSAAADSAAPAGPPGPPPGAAPALPAMGPPVEITAAIDIRGGTVLRNARADAAVRGKAFDAVAARGLQISSRADRVNGLYVHGGARFTLSDSRIELAGRGSSDFDGVAAGAFVRDNAKLTLRKVDITTRGVVSSAATATGGSTLEVFGSRLVALGGPLPSGYVRKIGPGMMEPPTPLGIVGTARTTLTMGASKAYYHDSTLIAEGWGVLSTDAARGAYLEANRCDIRVLRSGYGAYADNGATVVINDSTMDTATFGGIIAGQASMSLHNVRGVSRGNVVMIHNVMGAPGEVATLRITGGRFTSTNAAIVVKSANADITIAHARLEANNGDLLLSVVNDDLHATDVDGRQVPGIKALISQSTLAGNLIHLDTDRTMAVQLVASQLKGVVRNVVLSLDEASHWTATADSSIRLGGPLDASRLDAPAGVTITVSAEPGVGPRGSQVLPGGGRLVTK